jgi:hypothetical protein
MASNAAYTHTLRELDLPDLLTRAELVQATTASFGWQYVTEAITEHERKMTARLLNEATKPEDIPYLRGLLSGLRSMREAAETIVAFAADREAEAKQEHAHAR